MNIFVSSIGEKAGKTIFSAGIAAVMQSLGYEMAVYKPIQTGCKFANNKQFSPDLNFVKKIDPNIKTYTSFNFTENRVPIIAFNKTETKFKMDSIIKDYNSIKNSNDIIIVEGVGGILTPITGRISSMDLALNMKIPIIIVINVEGDFVNKTLMTMDVLKNKKADVAGIVFNKYSPDSKHNPYHEEVKLLETMLDFDVLGYIPNVNIAIDGINPELLISETLRNVSLGKLFGMEIPKLDF